ncbi:MAG: ABC transporter substrate-binding protein [Clostridia bacterium]|nr:ABC transporter substrate-binding protein [Clostridia bacterium]
MKHIKTIAVLLVAVLSAYLFCGCNAKYNDNYVYFNVETKPVDLDPQTALADEELLIVRNIFEGLLRKNEKGEIVGGVSKSYTKSGLTYTFNLRENAVWSDGTPLTADDFVFGLRRAVTPKVKAPFVARLYAVKNAKDIYIGKKTVEQLGVKAVDKTTLKITLEKEDKNFIQTLTTSIAMPCNKAFFNKTVGKYGLCAECVLSNGSYALKKWNPDDFGIRLYRNETYNGDFYAKNGAVFISNKEDETPSDFFSKNSVDCAFVKSKDLDAVTELGINKNSYETTCWFLTVSDKMNPYFRKAFTECYKSDIYKDKLPSGFRIATSIYPEIISKGKDMGSIEKYNLKNAKAIFSDVITSMPEGEFPKTSLVIYDNESIKPAVRAILGHWQKNLSAFINITSAKHPEELVSQLKHKTVDFAVFPVTAKSTDSAEYLKYFGKSGNSLASVQKSLLENNTLLPIAFEDLNICYTSALSNLYTDSENGYIDFSFAIKKN